MSDWKPRACDGEQTRSVQIGCFEGEECEACEVAVAWDLTEHPFFGFKSACGMKVGRSTRGFTPTDEGKVTGSAENRSSSAVSSPPDVPQT